MTTLADIVLWGFVIIVAWPLVKSLGRGVLFTAPPMMAGYAVAGAEGMFAGAFLGIAAYIIARFV